MRREFALPHAGPCTRPVRLPLCQAVIAIVLASSAAAQVPVVAVTGTVRDGAGNPIAATVQVRDLASGYVYGGRVTPTGQYWIPNLRPGRYRVDARALSFRPDTVDVELGAGTTAVVDLTLQGSGIVLQSVEVQSSVAKLAATQADVRFTTNRKAIERLPLESRYLLDLAQLAPGATSVSDPIGRFRTTSSVGGLDAQALGVFMDGGDMMTTSFGQVAGGVPLLAVESFDVVTSRYAGAYGHSASGIVEIATRRGTNDRTVEAFGMYRHKQLNALGTFEAVKPNYNRIHAGAAAGGPIATDRTHYFIAAEHKKENKFTSINTGGLFPQFEGTFTTPFTNTLLFGRVDHHVSERHDLTFRYSADLNEQLTNVGTTGLCNEVVGYLSAAEHGLKVGFPMHSAMIAHRWGVSERAVNELRFSALDWKYRLRGIGTPGPELIYPTLCAGAATEAQEDLDLTFRRFELREDFLMTLVAGAQTHRLRFGGQLGLLRSGGAGLYLGGPRGAFYFDTDTSTQPSLAWLGIDPVLNPNNSNVQFAVYVQDDWNPTPRLTLTPSLRYDIESNGTNQGFVSPLAGTIPFVRTTPRPVDKNNVAPRLGFAYDLDGSGATVVRGGAGIFYGRFTEAATAVERGTVRQAVIPNPGTTDRSQIPIDTSQAIVLGWVAAAELPTPVTREVSLGIERSWSRGLTARVDVIRSRSRNLMTWRNINAPDASGVSPYPQFAYLAQGLMGGQAESDLLLVQLQHRLRRSWYQLAYTLGDRKTTSDAGYENIPDFDLSNDDFSHLLAPARWDERHRLVATGGLRAPFGFELTAKGVYSSPRPYSARTGLDENRDGSPNDWVNNEGRNSRRGPDYRTLDMGVVRFWNRLGSQIGMTLNVYNALNRTNYNPLSIVQNTQSPLFGKPLSALDKRQIEMGVEVRY